MPSSAVNISFHSNNIKTVSGMQSAEPTAKGEKGSCQSAQYLSFACTIA